MRNQSTCSEVDPGPEISGICKLLEPLLACDTCFPPGANYREIVELIQKLAAPLGGTSKIVEVPEDLWRADHVHGPRVNLILRPDLGPVNAAEVTIYFHIDTAPVGAGWRHEPLAMTRHAGRIYGRGAADMKGAIAAALEGLSLLRRHESRLAFRPVLAFCTDEEGGRYPGIRYLVEQGLVGGALLNLNGSAEPRIWSGCFGSVDYRISLKGRGAHSGRPEGGINAVTAAMPVLQALTALKARIESRRSAMPAPDPETHLFPRLNITAIHGGDKGSALPALCRIVVNRRYMPEENLPAVSGEIEQAVSAALTDSPLLGWNIEEVGHLPPVTDPDGPLTSRWTDAMAAGFNVPRETYRRYGSTTSSDFGWVQKAGLREIMLGGLSRPGHNVHGPDEFTTEDDLVGLARSVALFFSDGFCSAGGDARPTTEAEIKSPEEIL